MSTRVRIVSVALLAVAASLLNGCVAEYQSLDVDGQKRHYLLHVPETLPEAMPVPLLLALHQFLDTPAGMRDMTGFNALADGEGFIVAYPRGCWRRWDTSGGPGGRDHRFLSALIAHLQASHAIDTGRIYGTGASAGAMMIQSFARHVDLLAGIAPVMGTLTEAATSEGGASAPMPVIMIHGTEDPVIPYDGGLSGGPHGSAFLSAEATAAYWAEAVGCNVSPEVETLPVNGLDTVSVQRFLYACVSGPDVLLLAIRGCGHSWPGHQSRFPAFIVGPSVSAPDASRLIWSFFEQQTGNSL